MYVCIYIFLSNITTRLISLHIYYVYIQQIITTNYYDKLLRFYICLKTQRTLQLFSKRI